MNEKLTKNFALEELVLSETAERDDELLQQQRNPPQEVIDHLRYLCHTTLQPIRDKLEFPIHITSGYRSPAVNKAVRGSPTSQHCFGQAVDCTLSSRFLSDPGSKAVRQEIEEGVETHTGKSIRESVNANFYLFAYVCLHLGELDIDQVIHEYGLGYGKPAWVHISASEGKNKRQIVALGHYVPRDKRIQDLGTALEFGV
ncbi:MAG: DUF882 domain-containing protein [Nitrospirales bacterium]|nr:DUF882 domain-containing protein [Nitrospirales bacterium]